VRSFGGALREALGELCTENFCGASSKASCGAFGGAFGRALCGALCGASSIALVARRINYGALTLS